jgi:hypothetical protein
MMNPHHFTLISNPLDPPHHCSVHEGEAQSQNHGQGLGRNNNAENGDRIRRHDESDDDDDADDGCEGDEDGDDSVDDDNGEGSGDQETTFLLSKHARRVPQTKRSAGPRQQQEQLHAGSFHQPPGHSAGSSRHRRHRQKQQQLGHGLRMGDSNSKSPVQRGSVVEGIMMMMGTSSVGVRPVSPAASSAPPAAAAAAAAAVGGVSLSDEVLCDLLEDVCLPDLLESVSEHRVQGIWELLPARISACKSKGLLG